jgi:lipid A ethanolaminephosphotransferase
MSLRLFHATEFAASDQLSPEAQRKASHPLVLILVSSLWLASVCNFPLWRELSRLPGLDREQMLWLAPSLLLMMTATLCAVLSLLNCRVLLKSAIVLLLLLSALNVNLQTVQGGFIDSAMLSHPVSEHLPALRAGLSKQALLVMATLALLPSIWLLSTRVRRLPLPRALLQNFLLFAVSCAVFGGLWWLTRNDVLALFKQHSELQPLINPFNTLRTTGEPLLPDFVWSLLQRLGEQASDLGQGQ